MRNKRRYSKTLGLFIFAGVIGIAIWLNSDKEFIQPRPVSANEIMPSPQMWENGSPPYTLYRVNKESPSASPDKAVIAFDIRQISSISQEASVAVDAEENALNWSNGEGWVEWTVSIPETGSYELEAEYMSLGDRMASPVRGLMVDGAYPFAEAERLVFEKTWKDAKYPYERNEINQEIRPGQVQIEGWKIKAASDYTTSSTPLLFELTEGSHRFRLVGVREGLALKALRFVQAKPIPTYAEYADGIAADEQGNWFTVIEAENYAQKSGTSIQTQPAAEPHISPDPKGSVVYNTLGGERWRTPGEWAEWEIEVPDSGWYEIDLKYHQGYKGGFKTFRTLQIDGSAPFREMLHYPIDANLNFQIRTLQSAEEQNYRFHLEKGKHTIRLVADASPVQPALLALQQLLEDVRELDRSVRLVTGNYGRGATAGQTMDTLRTWDMKRYDPEIESKINKLIDKLSLIRDYVDGMNGQTTDMTNAVEVGIEILQGMNNDVNEIPNRLEEFSVLQSSLGSWLSRLNDQPLLLDYLVVRKPGADTGLKEPNAWNRIPYTFVNFARSFYTQYDRVGIEKENSIQVWVQRGRNYAEALQQLIDMEFTPRTGIAVEVSLMPNVNQLILSNAAGKQPDVALGLGMELPADYAMRQAVADLKQFGNYEEVMERFHPGAVRSFAYDEGVYALPEVMSYTALYYRTDIFEQLKLEPPDTWEDVYKLLPTLQENGMTMYYPTKDFVPFFYQNGAEFFSPDGRSSTLQSAEALKAFRMWTEMYTKFMLPMDVPAFFNHFREGDMPIGIGDFNTYVQLMVSAPEITGHWKMLPLPGIRSESGEVARWSAQTVTGAAILEKSDKKDQAWAFLDWWTSDEVQLRYGNEIEANYGLEFRWNTANLAALREQGWTKEELNTIMEQGRWVKNVAYVPGYYFLPREMDFAWNRVVLGGQPPKAAIDQASLELQREMTRRQQDFGLAAGDPLQLPELDDPYNWGGGAP